MSAVRLRVTGVVQGVGFRPRVWTLARRLGLRGLVRNDGRGVEIEAEGPPDALQELARLVRDEAPPAARVADVVVEAIPEQGHVGFAIVGSGAGADEPLPVSPELATCADCLRELRDPSDRRHRHPFVNCTGCGPRFTIVTGVPYDRPRTTMAGFPLCGDCAREYADPADRRFHAQPVACPRCGPRLALEAGGRVVAREDEAVRAARGRLAAGEIVAVKGLGGYHLACDGTSAEAVERLRRRKVREEKPFALMAAGLAAIERHAVVTPGARSLLESREAPIVLLPAREPRTLPGAVAPGRDRLGFMLPHAPLHWLLLERAEGFPEVLVMTSGNRSDEPIAFRDDDARARLGPVADAFLLHDRPIDVRVDDSVVAERRDRPVFFRRSRGWAPLPLPLPFPAPPLLAVGGELKNTFCLARGTSAYLSHHVGDLQHAENVLAFEQGIEHYQRLFSVEPELFACDLHPDYRSTRVARERSAAAGLPLVEVQHHHAHVASAMAEHGLPEGARVLGFSFDGTGYGPDGTIWGGEVLDAGYRDFERPLHLAPCPLPGGDASIRAPYRVALAWLRTAGIGWAAGLPPVAHATEEERAVLAAQIASRLSCPDTTSVGRLFDAVSSLIGLRQRVSYEGQAACELEALAVRASGERAELPFALGDSVLDPAPALQALVDQRAGGVAAEVLAARFHRGLAAALGAAARRLREERGLGRVVLSGGVWQNLLLLSRTCEILERDGFEVLVHAPVPAGDGGLALGQAAVAAARRLG